LKSEWSNACRQPEQGLHLVIIICFDNDSIPTGEASKDSVHLHFEMRKLCRNKLHRVTSFIPQFADAMHRSYGSRLTSKITVNVNSKFFMFHNARLSGHFYFIYRLCSFSL
jgi:hypothetical protein